jgi:hypothetical protein
MNGAYIRMPADLLDDGVIEMSGIAQEVASNVVCMLETLEDIGGDWELRAFPELRSLNLSGSVDVLHPAVMVRGRGLADVLLEDDDVGIWDFDRVRRGEERSNSLVNGLGVGRGCR